MDIHNPELDPILLTSDLAEANGWEISGYDEDFITVDIDGEWRNYGVTIVWHALEDDCKIIRMICSFEIEPPAEQLGKLYELFNHLHFLRWASNFSFQESSSCIFLKRAARFHEGSVPSQEYLYEMIKDAVAECDKYNPVIATVLWTDKTPKEAMSCAIHETQGTA